MLVFLFVMLPNFVVSFVFESIFHLNHRQKQNRTNWELCATKDLLLT